MPPERPNPPTPEDRRRVEHIIRTARDAQRIVGLSTIEDIRPDMIRTRALVNCFTEIGEAASRLSPDARSLLGDLPWRQIVGMRNIIVHVYWGIDLAELLSTTKTGSPSLITACERMLTQLESEPDTPKKP